MKKYNYSVKVNGRWYPPNTEISENAEKPAEEVKENDQGTSEKSKSGNNNKQ